MNFAVMPSAQGDRELITDLAAERAVLHKAQMVSIRRVPAADQALLLGNGFNMLPVANAAWRR